MQKKYREEKDLKNMALTTEILEELPYFLKEFFRGITDSKTSATRLNYAYDLRNFFNYLITHEYVFKHRVLKDIDLNDLDKITSDMLEAFLDFTTYYEKETTHQSIVRTNKERGKSRKLSAIKTMFAYFLKKKKISTNPAILVETPKIREKTIVRLEIDEVARLLDSVEQGDNLTKTQKKYHNLTKKRDLAILTLFLGTGIRVSECVGIDLEHINFDINAIKIIRKGGNESIIYIGSEVEEALKSYIEDRLKLNPLEGYENALFLSMQNKRLTDRAVQNLVKKYTKQINLLKNISPHKLRSTYGTNLYKETGDIYLVATILGHKDVNTTKKHYAQMDIDIQRRAANVVKLRKS